MQKYKTYCTLLAVHCSLPDNYIRNSYYVVLDNEKFKIHSMWLKKRILEIKKFILLILRLFLRTENAKKQAMKAMHTKAAFKWVHLYVAPNIMDGEIFKQKKKILISNR